ncbi:1-deoxy-D-xylulose-5-phosphate synthase N-terminal domain-containing protein, partial [Actinosynnema sp. NPDC023658]|uniref:1-deoxy-D-xylulose-5-phosphate synthase N-terminal domain-containing protein n=1 Tax=Actinosynnema sp. NPDC023658 TaxID=3155465 RepID=UPI00340D869E
MTAAGHGSPREDLEVVAAAVRDHVVEMCAGPEGGHLGGSMSAVEILVALYFHAMHVDPDDPERKGRDVFVLSKGHSAMAL